VRETRDQALALAVPGQMQIDLMESAAIVPTTPRRIDDPTTVQRLRVRFEGVEMELGPDVQGGGQSVDAAGVFEIRDTEKMLPGPADPAAREFLAAEAFLESDAPEIIAEARTAIRDAHTPREQANRLVRYVNALLEKKPTVSLPSAREVLRTRVGDCNEHTALYVALARAAGLPARIAVGLVHVHGAFYYHAWAEVYVEEEGGGQWLPVDPTLNQFPADATHLRLARGGLEQQAEILSYLGRARLTITELVFRAGYDPVLVGRPSRDVRPFEIEIPRRDGRGRSCWSFLRRN
jgi:transglutaminase-like putative cysteine protease